MSAGRFAPSPTGGMHAGNLRTALLAWLFARDAGLGFWLRIEDLDQPRARASSTQQEFGALIENQLRALGVEWDLPVLRQSERVEIYRDAVVGLDSYECYCTRREIAEAAQAPHGSYRPYPGTCAWLSDAERAQKRAVRPAAIRVRARGASFTVHDRHAGEVTGLVDDFVLFRNDGTPAYNLAVVVDDGLQGVSQVCRGSDLLESAPRQAWLAEQLGFAVPQYLHVGLAVNAAGDRLAKRDGAADLDELARRGVSPALVCRLLCASAGLPEVGSAPELPAAVRGTPWWRAPGIWDPWLPDLRLLSAG